MKRDTNAKFLNTVICAVFTEEEKVTVVFLAQLLEVNMVTQLTIPKNHATDFGHADK